MKTLAIAKLTFSVERHRTEILIILLIGFFLTSFMSFIHMNPDMTKSILGTLSESYPGENTLMLQGGLFYAEVCVYLIAFMIGMNSFFGDQKSGVLDIILIKPLSKAQYLLGKFVGGLMVSGVSFLIMILPITFVEIIRGDWNIVGLTILSFFFGMMKVVIYLSLTLFFLMRVPRMIAPMIALAVIITGYYSQKIDLLIPTLEGVLYWLYSMGYFLIPHLTEVSVATIFDPVVVKPSYGLWFLIYGLGYPTLFLSLAVALFKRKSL